MGIYTYAIIDSNQPISGCLKGLDGSLLFSLPYREIGIVVSYAREKALEAESKSVLRHEEVIEMLMEDFTVLPMRFNTIFKTEENISSMMGIYYADFCQNLKRIRNCVEYGLKVIWSWENVRENILSRHPFKPAVQGESPFKNFINDKYKNYSLEKEIVKEANRIVTEMNQFLEPLAFEKKMRILDTENLLLNASYLVEKKEELNFKEAFQNLREAFKEIKVLFSGPWPAYNFITLTKKPDLAPF